MAGDKILEVQLLNPFPAYVFDNGLFATNFKQKYKDKNERYRERKAELERSGSEVVESPSIFKRGSFAKWERERRRKRKTDGFLGAVKHLAKDTIEVERESRERSLRSLVRRKGGKSSLTSLRHSSLLKEALGRGSFEEATNTRFQFGFPVRQMASTQTEGGRRGSSSIPARKSQQKFHSQIC